MKKSSYPVEKTDAEWKKQLDPLSYNVLREQGTEHPFSGAFNNHFETGTYLCKGCGASLYQSNNKFESGCGWPSFDAAIPGAIEYKKDNSHGMLRTEIVCAQCGSHQGHVFDDGPTATGMRYCVNSVSIDFKEQKKGD